MLATHSNFSPFLCCLILSLKLYFLILAPLHLVQDETGVCKNLLQETTQKAGVPLPVYTSNRTGPGHLPVYICTVDVAGRKYIGQSAKTKKQAEKNAAAAAWAALKKCKGTAAFECLD